MFWRLKRGLNSASHCLAKCRRSLRHLSAPRLSRKMLETALDQCVIARASTLFVHSSLSACGYICDGAHTVITALADRCNLLVLPTHTYCYPTDPSQLGPHYNPLTTRSLVGEITNAFWQRPGVMRSIHPTHSLAASGSASEEFLAGHVECDTPCGNATPYERLVQRDTSVLMFGATMDTYTLFHTAEDAASCPYLYCSQPYTLRAFDYDGELHVIKMRRQDMSVPRRFEAMGGVLEGEGLLRRTRLGRGTLLFIESSRAVHEFVVDKLRHDPFYLVAENRRESVRQKCASQS